MTTNGGSAEACLPTFAIGSFAPARPIGDNTNDGDKLVRVQCVVAPSGDGYFVKAAAVVDGLGLFAFRVEKLPSSGSRTGSPNEIAIGWGTDTEYLSDEAAKCTLDTTFDPRAGVAPGRYWASFSCTGLKTKTGSQCSLSGELRLENCAQAL